MNRRTAAFTRLDHSTREDWDALVPFEMDMARGLPQRVLAHLRLLDGDAGGFPVNRYVHSLQAATLALRDGRDEEYVVCALLHDLGDTLGSYNHADVAAAVLEPFVDEANLWMVRHHAVVQGHHFFHHIGMDRNLRDVFRDQPHYERTVEFVDRFDNPAFDPSRAHEPIDTFAPMLKRVMAAPKRSLYAQAVAKARPP